MFSLYEKQIYTQLHIHVPCIDGEDSDTGVIRTPLKMDARIEIHTCVLENQIEEVLFLFQEQQ